MTTGTASAVSGVMYIAGQAVTGEAGVFHGHDPAAGTTLEQGFRNGSAEFILQNFADEAFASNLMILVVVPDLALWWEAVSRKRLEQTYPGFRMKPPTDFPWGREVHFIDPAGVCWHVAER